MKNKDLYLMNENEDKLAVDKHDLKRVCWLNYILISLLGISTIFPNIINNNYIPYILIFIILSLSIYTKWKENQLRNRIEERANKILEQDKSDLNVQKMELLLRFFYNSMNFGVNDSVTIVVHQKLDDERYLKYTNVLNHNGKDSTRNKEYSIKKGIVKKAFEANGGEFHDSFKDDKEKVNKLVQEYNYSLEEAEEMRQDGKMSYYCRTIRNDEKTWGVIYMTSSAQNRFTIKRKGNRVVNPIIESRIKQLIELIQNDII